MNLCALYFSHSQTEAADSPFVYKEISTSELLAACRTLKTRLLSHTAGLLDLTQSGIFGNRISREEWDLDPLLLTSVEFFHKTVRDFLLDNVDFKSITACEGLSEAQARISIARGTLSQISYLAREYAIVVDRDKPSPVYKPVLASLQQISLAERSLGAAQVALMSSLDFATFSRGFPVVHNPGRYGGVEAFMIETTGQTSMDLFGMAAAVGMTLYVCEQLDLPNESSRYLPNLPNPDVYRGTKAAAAALCWNEASRLQYPGSFLASGSRSSTYRQTLERCLHWETNERSSGSATGLIDNIPLAETYMLYCCKLWCSELIRILLRARANPTVRVKCLPRDKCHPYDQGAYMTESFWERWLSCLSWHDPNENPDHIIHRDDNSIGKYVSLKDVIDTTKALLFYGANINYCCSEYLGGPNQYLYFERQGWKKRRFELIYSYSAGYILEERFANQPEFCEFFTAMKSLGTNPIVGIVPTDHRNSLRWGCGVRPNAKESDVLWHLIKEWERTRSRDGLYSLRAAIEVVYRAHRPDWDLESCGVDWTTDDEDDDSEKEEWSNGSDRADDEDEGDDSHLEDMSDGSDHPDNEDDDGQCGDESVNSHLTDKGGEDSYREDGSDDFNGVILDS
ncbi:MAG: hypothetical protein Q9198_002006 [Flavoplaca austrocitrina]